MKISILHSYIQYNMRFTYPAVRREAFSEVLHGHTIADPYRWLEDPNSSETTAFVEAQNSLFHGFTDSYPRRETLKQQ
jgi:prolyl oligopeptidase